MKVLKVKQLASDIMNDDIDAVSRQLDKLDKEALDQLNWPDYPYKPEVDFAIAFTDKSLLLKYYVTEAVLRAANGQPNSAVYEDTCVEFFIAFDESGYYNFECNCVGAILAGFGKARTERTLLNETIIEQINRELNIHQSTGGGAHWEALISIPFEVFAFHQIDSLQGKTCKANFYKCGDLLPQPHYLSWSAIEAPAPNFHLPEFFGELSFE